MKIKLSRSQWEAMGKQAGWEGNPIEFDKGDDRMGMDMPSEEDLEGQFKNKWSDFTFYYSGENNEGASGRMGMNINEITEWLKKHLSSEALELFFRRNIEGTDVDLQRNIEGIFNAFWAY